jgi:hypothetical protein
MTRSGSHKQWIIVVGCMLFPLVVSLACNTITRDGSDAPTGEFPGESPGKFPMEIKEEIELSFGPGPFNFPDPKSGLSDLSGYTTTVMLTFDGTRDGKAEKWTKTYTMLMTTEPAARQMTIEKSGNLLDLDSIFMAEIGETAYEKRGETACEAGTIQEEYSLADRFEPASFLGGVIGAEQAGAETINSIPATHYTFDQRALGAEGIAESSGELWVADEGGYLVRYLLTTKAGEEYFGPGIEGTVSVDYEMKDPNPSVEMDLPADCPPGLVDAPTMLDAANVQSFPGILSYDTKSSIADIVAFYQEQLLNSGWTLMDQSAATDTVTILTFTQGDREMQITIITGDAGTQVRITMDRL